MLPLLLLCGRNFVPACPIRLDVHNGMKRRVLRCNATVEIGG
jgi:hypothetical protein